ncbi:M48 family metallopeptidase [Collimonas sp.]|jgi:Zn-dependent protease with chaperone function|uniref:M48 family metallopeptidase n=1 Tax=Collimonas sp. TaxID=1963772 RepID=UPI002C11EF0B|nr:M48 family metallopeptidase [Collimonas sp.]HWW08300.1 M48 family metallopeptidase [Collimonas sp.]
MENTYPAGPASVPGDLAKPTKAYRNRAWLAVGCLALFIALYFFLAGWFALTAYRLIEYARTTEKSAGVSILAAGCAAFLAIFMLKALFFTKQIVKSDDPEITPEQQPRLFEFLYRLADEAGAPRPHRVFLSARVNAAVFYDLSILNLIYPSKKNLEIGLGLVNVLSLGELKAVCAHEFGHFAQRSMAVGRWVYTAQQIAAHIVAKRDALDSFLASLSRFDIRIAWIGWGLGVIIWSIRSLIDLAFRGVVLAQRALAREMEMQADLVAVSLTGSDTLIHALHRLGVADDAWDRALRFCQSEAADKRPVKDVFAVQSRIIELFGALLADPLYGKYPPLPADNAQGHRVFKADFALPPSMWATHPLNYEREENAKRNYVPAASDDRSAWTIFDDAQSLREQASARLAGGQDDEPAALDASLAKLEGQYAREYFNRAYRGVYLGRSVTRQARRAEDLFDPQWQADQADLQLLYPESLRQDLEQMRNLEKEVLLLESLQSKAFVPADGVIRYRGRQLRRSELPQVIEESRREAAQARDKIYTHDRLCRTVHLAAARKLGHGWEEYLKGLIALLHYADHTDACLRDAQAGLRQVIAVETAGGRRQAGNDGAERIVQAAGELYRNLAQVYKDAAAVVFDASFVPRIGAESWQTALGEFELKPPHRENLNDWIRIIDWWLNRTLNGLTSLSAFTLERLLLSEAAVAKWTRGNSEPEAAPAPAQAPKDCSTLVAGNEPVRVIQAGWWQRFQSGHGWAHGLARFTVAGGVIGAVLLAGSSLSTPEITIYNGLGRAVQVSIADHAVTVPAFSSSKVEVPHASSYHVETHDERGRLIESFEGAMGSGQSDTFYNVAAASPLVKWTAAYGGYEAPPPQRLGVTRWGQSSADVLFAEPPNSIQAKGGGLRTVLSGAGDAAPSHMLNWVAPEDMPKTVATHARWSASHDPYLMAWLSLAAAQPGFGDILQQRLADDPRDMVALRMQQDSIAPAERASWCAQHTALAAAAPDNPDLRYIAVRCMPNSLAKNQAFDEGHRRWPGHGWFAYAAGYTAEEGAHWADASEAMISAVKNEPALKDVLSVDIARLRRMQAANPQIDIADLARSSPSVRTLMVLETGEGIGQDPAAAYHELALGRMESAVAKAKGSVHETRVLRLAAASSGAPRALVAQALALPLLDSDADEVSVFTALALAIRAGKDIAPYRAALGRLGQNRMDPAIVAPMLRFADALRAGNLAQAQDQLDGLPIDLRATAYSMGVTVLGERAPADWRLGARCLLFASERPYFG